MTLLMTIFRSEVDMTIKRYATGSDGNMYEFFGGRYYLVSDIEPRMAILEEVVKLSEEIVDCFNHDDAIGEAVKDLERIFSKLDALTEVHDE